MLTRDRLIEVLDYDPATGIHVWCSRPAVNRYVKAWNTRYAGKVAGRRYRKSRGDKTEYVVIEIDDRPYAAHRLAWLRTYGAWPTNEIDHKDRNGTNNAIENLRDATSTCNKINTSTRVDNVSGRKGVCWDARRRNWRAEIAINRRRINLGSFNDFSAACAARSVAELRYHA